MATLTLQGVSDYSVACARSGGGSNVGCINDNNDATFVNAAPLGSADKDLYNLANCGLSDVTISNVALFVRYSTSGDATGWIDPKINSGGTEYTGTRRYGVSIWTEFTQNWAVNPNGGGAWTPAAIDALIFGYNLYSGGSGYTIVAKAYIVVTYTVNTVPTVTTTAISANRPKSAASGGNVTASDTPCTAKGICWNLTGTPTIGDTKTNDGTGLGAFTSYMTGLLSKRTYHVRAYGTNTTGTGYGSEVDFTTPAVPQIISF